MMFISISSRPSGVFLCLHAAVIEAVRATVNALRQRKDGRREQSGWPGQV